jgi:hypothetical protein
MYLQVHVYTGLSVFAEMSDLVEAEKGDGDRPASPPQHPQRRKAIKGASMTLSTATSVVSVKFTKKSANDKYPTVTLARLTEKFGKVSVKNGYVTLFISSKSNINTTYQVKFRQNRTGSGPTLIATEWPQGLRKPSVGRSIEFVVKHLI